MHSISADNHDEKQIMLMNRVINNVPRTVVMMFASPLVRCDTNVYREYHNVEPMQLLNHTKEFQYARKGLSASKKDIKVKTVVATIKNFQNALKDNIFGLHFSGHGFKNLVENVGN